ncbi:MAG: hypothetical protein QME55_15225, partial [Brevundimonas sp.]|nr:hypothetical protein [Brevundimonas sp.]
MLRTGPAVLAALTLALGGCAAAGLASPAAASESRPAVTVTRDGDSWTADYVLDRDAPVWAFYSSSLIMDARRPWRLEQWRVLTP